MVLTVAHHLRPPVSNAYSLEKVFESVRNHLPREFSVRIVRPSRPNGWLGARFLNTIEAGRQEADVHHVLGDTHYVALALPRDRTVVTVADTVFQLKSSAFKRSIIYWLWYRWPLRRATKVIAISDATRNALHSLGIIDKKHVLVIPCCTSRAFQPAPRAAVDSQRPRFLIVGTTENKNLERTFAALEGRPCEVDIVGRMTGRQQEAARQAKVEVREHIDLAEQDVVALYASCDVVLFASTFEGFGLPILEANLVERPVIAGNVCSIPEVAGKAAMLVDPFDVADIRRGIETVLSSTELRTELVEAGRNNRRRFAPEVVAEEYAAVYRSVGE